MGPEIGSLWISEHLHFNCVLAMSGWPRKTPVNCHSPPLEGGGRGDSPPTSNLVCFILNLEEAIYAQSKFWAIQTWGIKRFRGASSKMARYSFVNLVETQTKITCFYLFLAFACQGPQTLWTGQEILVEPKLHPTCSQAAVLQLVMNIWSGFATSPYVQHKFCAWESISSTGRPAVPRGVWCAAQKGHRAFWQEHAVGWPWKIGVTHMPSTSQSWNMSQGPNKFLSLGLALAPMWPPFGRTCSWLGSWGWFLFHRARCERCHFEKKSSSSCLACELQIQITDDRSCM